MVFRRVQWHWPEAYPFADDKTATAPEDLGLPRDAEELDRLLGELWDKLDRGEVLVLDHVVPKGTSNSDGAGGIDGEELVRR